MGRWETHDTVRVLSKPPKSFTLGRQIPVSWSHWCRNRAEDRQRGLSILNVEVNGLNFQAG